VVLNRTPLMTKVTSVRAKSIMKKRGKERRKEDADGTLRVFRPEDFIFLAACMIGILLGAGGIFVATLDYSKSEQSYQDLQRYVTLVDETPTQVLVNSRMKAAVYDQTYYIDWNSLREVNPDIVAWIKVPGTPIDYPVVQAPDNQTYLKKGFDGSKNVCGTVFMNAYNRTDFSDYNTVLYGHNMRNGSMFAAINKYRQEDYYKEHKEVWVFTPYWERKYQIISVHGAQDGSETYAVEFGDRYAEHVASEVAQSLYDTGNGYNVDFPMLTLSTCTGRGTLDRMVLVCQPVFETTLDPFMMDESQQSVTEQ